MELLTDMIHVHQIRHAIYTILQHIADVNSQKIKYHLYLMSLEKTVHTGDKIIITKSSPQSILKVRRFTGPKISSNVNFQVSSFVIEQTSLFIVMTLPKTKRKPKQKNIQLLWNQEVGRDTLCLNQSWMLRQKKCKQRA